MPAQAGDISGRYMELTLTPTARVVLGMLAHGARSGYDIKAFVDRSTRFFWAASYGQIYPELRRLEGAGLIEGESRPTGGRRRTEYRLTGDGRRALGSWLGSDPEVYELRDEALLKLFFTAAGEPDAAIAVLDAKRRHHEEVGARLREIQAQIAGEPRDPKLMVLRYGIEANAWQASWCRREAAELAGRGSG